jgi:hypothetical protein
MTPFLIISLFGIGSPSLDQALRHPEIRETVGFPGYDLKQK